jgi:primary-amine oxidase
VFTKKPSSALRAPYPQLISAGEGSTCQPSPVHLRMAEGSDRRMRALWWFPALLFVFVTAALAKPAEGPFHPLDALTPIEIAEAVKILTAAGKATANTRYPAITLLENPKEDIRQWKSGDKFNRAAFIVFRNAGSTFEAQIDLTLHKLISSVEKTASEPMIMDAEWTVGKDRFMADPRFKAAMTKRGFKDLKQVFCTPNSAGAFPGDGKEFRRILKVPCYSGNEKLAPAFARPIEGVMGIVDTETGEVLDVLDREVVELPKAPEGYGDTLPKPAAATKPIIMTSPKGTNIKLKGNLEIAWDRWSMHARSDKRAGLILSLMRFNDGKKQRDIAYQMNVSEMFVPYMSPDPTWSYRTFMDAGEFGLGYLISSMQPGVDCPAHAILKDLTFPNDIGGTYTKPNSLCIFERLTGDPAWRHYSSGRNAVSGVPQVELVVRHIPTLGNYDYVVDYVFSPQGNITLRVGATGFDAIKSTAAKDMESPTALADTAYGTLIAPYTVAINHDHYFNFRIDLDVDGPKNSVVRDAFVPSAITQPNPRKSLWTLNTQRYKSEGPIVPDHMATGGETWRVINPNEKTNLKFNPSYWINTHHQATSVLDAKDPPQMRAGFAAQTLWVTKNKPGENWAAGLYPNLSTQDEGLPAFVSDNEAIVDQDIVLWYTMGFRHAPRPEDFPVLPTFWHEMTLRPAFFFDMDPSMTFNPGQPKKGK